MPNRLIVNPLMGHPVRGWLLLSQNIVGFGTHKSYCICSLYDHQPRTNSYGLPHVLVFGYIHSEGNGNPGAQ